jgi:two-component system sensor histidine kinase KdpD
VSINANMVKRGKLTVFLGAAAGVGKTYAMLEAALERLNEGVDLVAGWVETHGRPETGALFKRLPVISPKNLQYRGTDFTEMDLEELISRHPELVLIDELAHTNIPGSRHAKRYQDVEELLSEGISVYTTLNIQHLESLTDIVTQITGITVQETVPDRILEEAAQIHLIDIPPEELIQRLKEGKVYIPEQADEALNKFFRPGNINALRELALRYTARRVDRQMESYMRVHGIPGPWPTGERVLVCVSPSPFSAQLIRTARRMAEGLQTEWIAVSVETPKRIPSGEDEKDRLAKNMRLAEELGAETINLTGNDVAEEIAELARKRNVSLIIIGKPLHSRFYDLLRGSVVDKVIRKSQGISVHVIPGQPQPEQKTGRMKITSEQFVLVPYVLAFLMMVVLTLLMSPFRTALGLVNIALVYLLPVLISAARWGTGPAFAAALAGVLTFDFFFVPPTLSFTVADFRYVISFLIFLLVGLITGTLSDRLKRQVNHSRQREARVAALYALSRDIAAVPDLDTVLCRIVDKVAEAVEGRVILLLPETSGRLDMKADSNSAEATFLNEREQAVAVWAFERGQKAGKWTETLEASEGLYLPLRTEQGVQGVLAVRLDSQENYFDSEQMRLLEAFAVLAAMAVNRSKLAEQAREAIMLVESERLRTALFNSLSHDLRTPLASIIGAVTGLLEGEEIYSPDARRDLLQTIQQGASRMNRFVNNLLDMARLESGMLKLNREWCDIQDIFGVAQSQFADPVCTRILKTDIQPELPLVRADFVLIEQVFINIIDNALKYSEPGSDIIISVRNTDKNIEVAVADKGQQIPDEDLGRIFDKFYRLNSPLQVSGSGLGLAICRGIMEAHGGHIWAENNPNGGVVIKFNLPLHEDYPEQVPDMEAGDKHGI